MTDEQEKQKAVKSVFVRVPKIESPLYMVIVV